MEIDWPTLIVKHQKALLPMSSIIISFPYSGALYSYFTDQLSETKAHDRMWHPYYKTLYGENPKSHINLALSFMLLYDEVWMAPADNHWPQSRLNPADKTYIPELGLHSDWKDFHPYDSKEYNEYVEFLCRQNSVIDLLENKYKVPQQYWKQLIDYALYDASMSAKKRTPILCSDGRRELISVLVKIPASSLHPLFTPQTAITFVESYSSIMGLALAPKTIEHLMDAKPNPAVRKYGNAFVNAALEASAGGNVDQRALANSALDAINTEDVVGLYSGALNWAATILKFIGLPGLAAAATGAGYLASASANDARWYEFKGSIDQAIDRAEMIRNLEKIAKAPDSVIKS